MVVFACCAFVANRLSNNYLPGKSDIISASGALVIGVLGNVYSRVMRGTAFTAMVTGVLFLVPVSSPEVCFVRPFNKYQTVWYRPGRWSALVR